MKERTDVFRKVALDRLSSPEELDELLQVTRLRGWLLLVAVALVMAAGGVWSVVGSIPVTSQGQGVLMPAREPSVVRAPWSALVAELKVAEGDAVVEGQPLARLYTTAGDGGAGEWATLTAPADGRVYAVLVASGETVPAEAPLLRLTAPDAALAATLFLAPAAARRVAPGMPVRLSPQQTGNRGGARVTGTVVRVAALPSSAASLERLVDDRRLAASLAEAGLRLRVDVRIDRAALDAAGWSARMPVDGVVVSGEERPIAYVVPWLRGSGGEG